ncbi:hypothetical protein PAESOLCIP111_03256 [Paenibacillus solanacearum]|uniref:LysM peptidoglycan-binding domain-containing protein n=1 Tax=Paenibacillus solanacearum TaxID=2048548 RepID=A0A916NQU6_9BACL|nr:LysM peptidoglycan-binding domain-containing protein [Paenibacillus solanacearum]CAG7631021.1 hypothetical protein PAESOLCIP111_03256 [Paenibacillus solanacearum]
MTAQQSGLRFDIYERVHLLEGLLGIKQLEEVELAPHIQVLPYGEQAVLRGNLLLTGTYIDEQNRQGQTLEHLIPVEITLPMNRVSRVEDIAVEIENFDVDLLSARSLNVTGVLSLNGLETVQTAETESWKEVEEEVVFVHEASRNPSSFPEPLPVSPAASAAEQASISGETAARVEPIAVEPSNVEPAQEKKEEPKEEPKEAAEAEAKEPAEPDKEATVQAQEVASAEPQEMKIAFGSKKPAEEAAAPVVKSYGLASLLKQGSGNKPDVRKPEEAEPEAAAAAQAERVEWKQILLSSRDEKYEFKRLRMCIVQKEETLETIAKRYEIHPREIALHNRLGDGEVSEGQVVYIPK